MPAPHQGNKRPPFIDLKQSRILPLLVLGVFLCAVSARALESKDIAAQALPGLVSVITFDHSQNPLALGSGFFVTPTRIVTNYHVIEGATSVIASLSGKDQYFVATKLLIQDRTHDLAVLELNKPNPQVLSLGDSDRVVIGERIYVLGNPEGLSGTFSEGLISSIRTDGRSKVLQISAPISHGSSGGPVINSDGKVIGVAVAMMKDGQNLNFAIPANYISKNILGKDRTGEKKATTLGDSSNIISNQKLTSITPDIFLTDCWFATGPKGTLKASGWRAKKSDSSAPVHSGQDFGIFAKFITAKKKFNYRVSLRVPSSPQNFWAKNAIVDSDGHTVIVDESKDASTAGTGNIGFYWGISDKDPKGRYELKLTVEGSPVQTFTFNVE